MTKAVYLWFRIGRKWFVILSLFLTLCVSAWFIISGFIQLSVDRIGEKLTNYSIQLDVIENTVSVWISENSGADTSNIQAEKETAVEALHEMMKNAQSGDWHSELRNSIRLLHSQMALSEYGVLPDNPTATSDLLLCEYLLENDIEPYVSSDICKGFNVMAMYAQALPYLCAAVSIVFSALYGTKCTYILQFPVSRKSLFASKFIALISEAELTVLIPLLAVPVCGVLFGFGSINYPVITENHFIYTAGELIGISLAATLFVTTLYTALEALLSDLMPAVTNILLGIALVAIPMSIESTARFFYLPFLSLNIWTSCVENANPFLIFAVFVCASAVLYIIGQMKYARTDLK